MQERAITIETASPLCVANIPDHPVSRLAPTPSGFLHIGNAVNFLVTWAIVRSRKGRLHLRIDDMDAMRFRPHVLEDIFQSLGWLGVDWDTGPSGPDDFYRNFSLQKKKGYYRRRLQSPDAETGLNTFVCQCSRASIKKVSPTGIYPGICRDAGLPFEAGCHAIRLRVARDSAIQVNSQRIDLAAEMGDFVLWRKDDQPAYHLASLVEDEDGEINVIVRGRDLLVSTAAQIYLAQCMGLPRFPACRFIHHGLVLGDHGQKLSKSRGAGGYALKAIRQSGGSAAGAVKTAARILGLASGPDAGGKQILTARDLKQALASQVLASS